MMKNTLLIIISLITGTVCFAQKSLMSVNEQNKYTYFQVKSALPEVDATALAQYLKSNAAGIQTATASNDGGVAGKGSVMIYKQGLITAQEDGEINYNFTIDFKDSKYRLILTDFVLIPYQRNRYGVFAPVDGKRVVLEKQSAGKQLNNYLDKIGAYSLKFDQLVTDYVNKKAPATPKPAGLKKVDTKKW